MSFTVSEFLKKLTLIITGI